MNPKAAAQRLDAKLREYPWYLTTAVGADNGQPVLLVYVKSQRGLHARQIPHEWQGFKVVARYMGGVRAIN